MENILISVRSDSHECTDKCCHEDVLEFEVLYLNQQTNKYVTYKEAKYLINHGFTYSLDENSDIHLFQKEDIEF